jgi:hypothetical protein
MTKLAVQLSVSIGTLVLNPMRLLAKTMCRRLATSLVASLPTAVVNRFTPVPSGAMV